MIANFVNAGKALRGEDIGDGFYGMVFQDSDAAKWLEARKAGYASTKVASDTGFTALRGPLVYCFEGVDNDEDILSLSIAENGTITTVDKDNMIKLQIDGHKTESSHSLYSMKRPAKTPRILTAVPYYTWGNRGLTQMRVWMPER